METTKKVWKMFGEWDFDKEQDWLNEMADQGWALKKVSCLGMKFEFEPCEPGEYAVGIVMLDTEKDKKDPKPSESETRIAELTAEGAELVAINQQWHYFRKKKSAGELVLFPDVDARIAHIDKVSKETVGGAALIAVLWIALDSFIPMLILGGIALYYWWQLKQKKDELLRRKAADTANAEQPADAQE
ncbi:MAG: DUF2812 domain-containing protein [Clostridia bacterium]|nr:DUF2812 domain-containing protein [Clostridia bacterium]